MSSFDEFEKKISGELAVDTTKPLIPAEGPSLFPQLKPGSLETFEAKLTPFQPQERQTPLQTILGPKGGERAYQFLWNIGSTLGFGLPEVAAKKIPESFYEALGIEKETIFRKPTEVGGKIAAGLGHLAGFIGGPAQVVGKMVGKLPMFAKPAVGKLGTLAQSIGRHMAVLGIASGAIEHEGKTLPENLANRVKAMGMGMATGAIFGGGRMIELAGKPNLSYLLRLGAVSATLDALIGRHPLDKRELAEKVFDYGLNAWFMQHGRSLKTEWGLNKVKRLDKEVRDTVKEIKKNKENPPKWKNPSDLMKEEIPKEPGLELRKIRKRLGIEEEPGEELPKTRAEQIKAFEEAGKVEVLPSAEKVIDRGEQPISQEFMYKRSVKGQEARPPWAGGLTEEFKRPVYHKGTRIDTIATEQQHLRLYEDILKMKEKEITELKKPRTWKSIEKDLAKDRETLEKLLNIKGPLSDKETLAFQDAYNLILKDWQVKYKTYKDSPTYENELILKAAMERALKFGFTFYQKGTEAGRGLAARKRVVTKGEYTTRFMKQFHKLYQNKQISEDVFAKLNSMDPSDPIAMIQFLHEAIKVPVADKIFEAWVNGLLSGPPTQVVNIVSNFFNLVEKPVTSFGAALLEAPKRLFGKEPEVYFGEAWKEFVGIGTGFKQAVRRMAYAWSHEESISEVTKIEVKYPKAIKGKKGRVVRIPTRALIAADEFFKGLLYISHKSGLAYREAVKSMRNVKGLSKAKWKEHVAKEMSRLMANPKPDFWIHKAAIAESRYRTFQKELGRWGKSIKSIRDTMPGARYIAPFLRVSINIPKYGLERTPLNIPRIIHRISTGHYKDIPGKPPLRQGQFPREVVQTAIGSAFSIAFFLEVLEGNITGGGPVDRNKRDLLYRQGWQPYSIKVGDKYFSYQRIEPLGTIFGIAADMGEIWDQVSSGDREKLAQRLVNVVTQNIENKTFMRGVSDALNAITNPTEHGARFLTRFAGSAVPTGAAYTAKAIDPTLRDPTANIARQALNEIKSRIPGLRQQVPARRDVYGQPLRREGGPVAQMVSPVWTTTKKQNLVDNELSRLGVSIGRPGRRLQIGRVKGKRTSIKLSAKEYERLLIRGGGVLFNVLSGLVSSYDYLMLNDEDKIKKIESTVRNVRRSINEPMRAMYRGI